MNTQNLFKSIACTLFILFTSLFFNQSAAQNSLSKNALQMVAGYGKHGSGDMNGIIFGTEYIQYFSNKFSLNYNFRGSINDDRHEVAVTNASTGAVYRSAVRFTTAGVQLGVNGQLSIARNNNHEFLASLGAFGRYQSASNGTDGYGVYGPNVTGQPVVLVELYDASPMETFAVGGIFQLHYNYTLNNKLYIGIIPGFQTDTNGDVIGQVALSVGKRF